MDNVFDFRNRLINEYSSFSRSFSKVCAQDILSRVEQEYDRGRYWPGTTPNDAGSLDGAGAPAVHGLSQAAVLHRSIGQPGTLVLVELDQRQPDNR